MDGSKKWYESTGLWGVIVMGLSMLAGTFGYDISQAMQVEAAAWLMQTVSAIIGIVSGIVAWRGRVRATKKIE